MHTSFRLSVGACGIKNVPVARFCPPQSSAPIFGAPNGGRKSVWRNEGKGRLCPPPIRSVREFQFANTFIFNFPFSQKLPMGILPSSFPFSIFSMVTK